MIGGRADEFLRGFPPRAFPDWLACLPDVCLRCSAGVRREGERMAVGLAFDGKTGVRREILRRLGVVVRLLFGRVLAL